MAKNTIDVIIKLTPKLSGAELIAVERRRQVEEEGWTPQHDDQWTRSELVDAAHAYLNVNQKDLDHMPRYWPWSAAWWKPKDPLRNLIKAGALIAAEIDRLLRIEKTRGVKEKPTVVCLCGSTRFGNAFTQANLAETLAGNIVLTIGCNMKSDTELFGHLSEVERNAIKADLDELHKRKIDLADEILVLNVGGYIGESTRSEILYAQEHGKNVRYLEYMKPDGFFK